MPERGPTRDLREREREYLLRAQNSKKEQYANGQEAEAEGFTNRGKHHRRFPLRATSKPNAVKVGIPAGVP